MDSPLEGIGTNMPRRKPFIGPEWWTTAASNSTEVMLVGAQKYSDEPAYLQHVTLLFPSIPPLPCLHAYIITAVPLFAGLLLEYGCCHGSYAELAAGTILAQVMKLLYTSVPLHSSEDKLRFALHPQSPEKAMLQLSEYWPLFITAVTLGLVIHSGRRACW